MDRTEIEYYTDWIISNQIYFEANGKSYSVRSPSREAKFVSQEIFFDFYNRSVESGVMDKEEMSQLLIRRGIWNDAKEKLLAQLHDEVEDLKVKVFELYTNTSQKNKAKQAIKDTNDYINTLISDKYSMELYTAEGVAQCAKRQFLLGSSIYNNRNKQLWKSRRCWFLPDNILIEAYKAVNKFNLNQNDYREIARSDHWRSLWSIRRVGNLFGGSVIDLSESQKMLLSWSFLYDNVYKSSECPPDEIVVDDDALDGWLIIQRRKRDGSLNKNAIDKLIHSDKIKNSQHIFIKTDEQDINKVYELNDVEGKIALQSRFKQMKRDGIVNEANMLDTRLKLQQQAAGIFK